MPLLFTIEGHQSELPAIFLRSNLSRAHHALQYPEMFCSLCKGPREPPQAALGARRRMNSLSLWTPAQHSPRPLVRDSTVALEAASCILPDPQAPSLPRLPHSPPPGLITPLDRAVLHRSPPVLTMLTDPHMPPLAFIHLVHGNSFLLFFRGHRWGFIPANGPPARPGLPNRGRRMLREHFRDFVVLISERFSEAVVRVATDLVTVLNFELTLPPRCPNSQSQEDSHFRGIFFSICDHSVS